MWWRRVGRGLSDVSRVRHGEPATGTSAMKRKRETDMNGSNYFQTLESRTMFNAVLPPSGDPGASIASNLTIEVEHQLPPGGGATVDGASGTGTGGNSAGTITQNSRRLFLETIVRPD
jgi:hypothetical protein